MFYRYNCHLDRFWIASWKIERENHTLARSDDRTQRDCHKAHLCRNVVSSIINNPSLPVHASVHV